MIGSFANWLREKRESRLGKPSDVSDKINRQLDTMNSLVEEQKRAAEKTQELRLFINRDEIRDRISGDQLRRGSSHG